MIFTRPLHLQSSKGSRSHLSANGHGVQQTHVKPICAILDHPLAFSGELTKVRSEYRGGDYRSRHSLSRLQEENRNGRS